MRALLVHGMGRTRVSMLPLGHALRGAGITPSQFGYSAAFQSVDQIVARLRARLIQMPDDEYVVIGASLGGVLLRLAIASLDASTPRPRRLFMLGTPNHSPRLARRFGGALWFRLLNGDSGRMLASEPRMQAIPDIDVPVTMIVGTSGPRGRWSLFGNDVNDGLVAVNETPMGGDEELIELPVLHPFMSYDRRIFRLLAERILSAS